MGCQTACGRASFSTSTISRAWPRYLSAVATRSRCLPLREARPRRHRPRRVGIVRGQLQRPWTLSVLGGSSTTGIGSPAWPVARQRRAPVAGRPADFLREQLGCPSDQPVWKWRPQDRIVPERVPGIKGGLWRRASRNPIQLTTGSLRFRSPAPSRNGRTIFAIGDQVRADRRDSCSGEWILLSLGPSLKSITELAYSPGGDSGIGRPVRGALVAGWPLAGSAPHGLLGLTLLDVANGTWAELSTGVQHFANWSRDSQYVYFERWGDDTAQCAPGSAIAPRKRSDR